MEVNEILNILQDWVSLLFFNEKKGPVEMLKEKMNESKSVDKHISNSDGKGKSTNSKNFNILEGQEPDEKIIKDIADFNIEPINVKHDGGYMDLSANSPVFGKIKRKRSDSLNLN